MKLKAYLLIFIFSLSASLFSQNKKQAIDAFVKTKGLENASLGFCAMDNTGKILYQHDKQKSLTPASVLKLVTTSTALEVLGSDYRIKTELAVDSLSPSRLLITGYGDPTLGSEYMDEPAKAFIGKWYRAIEKNVKGQPVDITIDDSYFGYDGISRKWIREDMGNYFAAGSYGISIFDNTYRLFFDTQGLDLSDRPVIVRTEPDMPDLVFTNNMTLNKTGQDNGYILGEPFSHDRLLMGDIPVNKKSFSIKGDIPYPGFYLGQTLATCLADSGIQVGAINTIRTIPFEGNDSKSKYKVFYTHHSPTLKDIIRVVNVRSNNHYTEHLIRLVGKKQGSDSKNVLAESINQAKKLWKEKGLNTDALFMYDGCGLAPSNAVSAEFICGILHYMNTKSKHKDAFFESLPRAGKEGTVRNLLKGTRLEGKVHLKSGSIANVQCYAGYVIVGKNKYPFAVMVNNFTGQRRNVVKAIEKLLLDVF
ncbi:D-alanyl-D-alanine carboxypeptidase/D-alanyl-D-alanine-endopeptidase [Dysgonomonas sp. 520]|uniref:D-alanyl-D-alanine carboxypeptidase/D-alanyl-D-alanine endopeptidase n=1 Tax=Dysgonomonas sp. 520 TaxID=2302931 RepID=UPI0013D30950|nr:D-alanyl-D-alanine carboxypeptidase/D-alanyl-D-alanine-endopeptidase [Dysgonomonas sp. 520]NDW08530.1 D-alanyl-D-alanine carboxypeptidase/D-alanyl-D-alanine-endopeptidase [Dysgonomonas sp. 520]